MKNKLHVKESILARRFFLSLYDVKVAGEKFSLTPPPYVRTGGVNHNSFIVRINPPPGRTEAVF